MSEKLKTLKEIKKSLEEYPEESDMISEIALKKGIINWIKHLSWIKNHPSRGGMGLDIGKLPKEMGQIDEHLFQANDLNTPIIVLEHIFNISDEGVNSKIKSENQILTKKQKAELIIKLKPYLSDLNKGNCFGGTLGEVSTCMCSGENEELHNKKQKLAQEALVNMVSIVEQFTNKKVYRALGTYSDIYFCDTESKKIILGIDPLGNEIVGEKSYA